MVRNPERIDEITEAVKEYWKEHPDMRLGQLICNINGNSDPFYMRDDQLMKYMDKELTVPLFIGENPWEDVLSE